MEEGVLLEHKQGNWSTFRNSAEAEDAESQAGRWASPSWDTALTHSYIHAQTLTAR